ncbi:MAG: R2-like ligand-binding oxidase [Candidatus Promineifilaceae bacterium]
MTSPRTSYTTTTRGLDRTSPAMRLFEKAKKLGVWNPSDIDFTQDRADWLNLSELEQEVLLHLTALFQAGEEAVTLDLLPLIMVIAREGRLEEEMFLTTFLWEEAKHVDFFGRFLTTVAVETGDLTRFSTPSYDLLLNHKLPEALQALHSDSSAKAQVIASVTYNMIVEGVLAETGYHAFFTALERNDLMPGLRYGIYKLKQDESRHIAYGVYLLSRLISAEPELWQTAQDTLNSLLPIAMSIISELFTRYPSMPFGLEVGEFTDYAMSQFQSRFMRLMQAQMSSVKDVTVIANQMIMDEP